MPSPYLWNEWNRDHMLKIRKLTNKNIIYTKRFLLLIYSPPLLKKKEKIIPFLFPWQIWSSDKNKQKHFIIFIQVVVNEDKGRTNVQNGMTTWQRSSHPSQTLHICGKIIFAIFYFRNLQISFFVRIWFCESSRTRIFSWYEFCIFVYFVSWIC